VEVARKHRSSRLLKIGIVAAVAVLAVLALSACTGPRVDGGGGITSKTAPTAYGVEPTGTEQEASSEDGKTTFMVDDAYTVGIDERKLRIYTYEEGVQPYAGLSVVENTTGQDMREVLESLAKSAAKTYKKGMTTQPEISFMEFGDREIGRIDYEFTLDMRSMSDKFFHVELTDDLVMPYKGLILVEDVNGWYVSWYGIFLDGDEVTPAVIEHAMETTKSTVGEPED
jgi:hypothetical protein